MNLAEAVVKLLGDTKALDQSIDSSKAKVNDLATTGEQSVSRFGVSVGTAVRAGAAVAAVGFAAMTKGSLDMERAQGAFQAATGRSREEAVQFTKDMNGLAGSAGTIGKTFQEITAAGTAVAQQFDLTGQKGADLTEQFLEFSKVTGQDSVGAVNDFDAVLDAFGEPAERATGLMDQLVKSNQEFGTDAGPAATAALQAMAPALQGLGEDLDTGVSLLNLFEESGLKAGSAAIALRTAVTNLKPGQTLDDLITQIASIEDPALRAQKAMEIFGTRSGIGLAQAIQPGMTSLDDFAVSIEDADGASTTAAENMLTTGDKIRGYFDQIGAGVRDLGQEFGPVLSGLGGLTTALLALGPKVTGPLFDMIKGLGAKLIPAGIIAGTVVGEAQGEAQALASTSPGVVARLFAKIAAMSIPLAGAGTTIGTAVGAAAALAIPLAIIAAGGAIVYGIGVAIRDTGAPNALYDAIFGEGADMRAKIAFYTGQIDRFVAEGLTFDEAKTAARARLVESFGEGMAAAVVAANESLLAKPIAVEDWFDAAATQAANSAAQVGTDAAESLTLHFSGGLLPGQGEAAVDAYMKSISDMFTGHASEIGVDLVDHLGLGMTSAEATHGLLDDVNTLKDALEKYLSPREQALQLIGSDYIETLRKGMESEDDDLKQAAQDIAIHSIATIENAGLEGKKGQKGLKQIGILWDQLLASGMEEEEAKTKLRAQGVSETVISGLDSPSVLGYVRTGAVNIVSAWRTALVNELGSNATKSQISAAIRASMGQLHGDSPPKEGPLRHIDQWGRNIGEAWKGGLEEGLAGGVDTALRGLGIGGDPLEISGSGESRVRVDHYVHGDPGVLDGQSEAGIAGLLQAGIDASPLIRQIRAQARVGA